MEYKDQLYRVLNIPKTPSRIVSLVPSQTELLVDLGLRKKLVGITKFCVHPESLRSEVAVVGGTKTIHLDRIQQLSPDIIICNKEENTAEMVEQLSSIAPVWVSDIYSVAESLGMIKMLGELLNVSEKSSELIVGIKNEMQSFQEFMRAKPLMKAVYIIWKNPYMAAGKNTFINELLRLNNFENIALDYNSRYPEISVDKMKEANVVLLSSEPFPFKENDVLLLQEELGVKVKLVDGEYFSWYGSRLQEAFSYFKTLH